MKLRILSDLHIEYCGCLPPTVTADAVVLAGDIGVGLRGIEWAAEQFADKGQKTIYVPGNHEYYGTQMAEWAASATTLAAERNILLGDTTSFRLEAEGQVPVRILAGTLWTDFELFGLGQMVHCAKLTQRSLHDYHVIGIDGRPLRWADTRAIHQKTLEWLMAAAKQANAAGEKVVVVTHHAPSLKSSAPCFRTDPVTAGFASNLEAFAAQNVDLWVHGHMHNSVDYTLGRCRVVANPRGYPRNSWNQNSSFENKQFNPELVVEV